MCYHSPGRSGTENEVAEREREGKGIRSSPRALVSWCLRPGIALASLGKLHTTKPAYLNPSAGDISQVA